MAVLTKHCIFGETKCWLYSVEWQKRGLPHAHILIWLKEKIRSNDIDKVISAELPNPETDPMLFKLVGKNMIHGPCGAVNSNSSCMVNGKCSKRFPKELIKETRTGVDGYPLYRRSKPTEGGYTTKINVSKYNTNTEIEVDNRWVVPYNPLLLKMFEAHINVEWCHSVKSIKYICKYVHKGSDQAVFQVLNDNQILDEVQAFQIGRYISGNEAVWRILNFPIHERYPTVVHLSVHLENGQRIYFNPNNLEEKIREPAKTTLTAFFKLCQNDQFAKTLLYCDVPRYYTWNATTKSFQRRKKGLILKNFLE